MNLEKIRKDITESFKKCALGRRQLRKSVIDSMNAGMTKEDILLFSNELGRDYDQQDVSLCSITAIGQALRHEDKYGKVKPGKLSPQENEKIKNKLKKSFGICSLARKELRKCIINALNSGLSKEEILALTDDIVGGLGKNEVSACAIVAVDEVLRYQETVRAKPLDIVKERKLERGDI
ncbi:MAG: hypothetical protein BV457_00680 [Thermoplasmata archaeon M9B1D]|nr:MAG: hypothetical protein BV457_00680 [Thermoplasmata archaeon M9B1D]PNX52045.1 MAG: hypothetical protein BV456_00815 [Thermoplasmata archaeon M8B2D]